MAAWRLIQRQNVNRKSLTCYAWLSIAAALVTIALKAVAYIVTGSVGLLSDAVESVVNLVGGVMALAMLSIAARPADEDHAYGHGKAEYFASGLEGGLILVAAVSIAIAAVQRLLSPQPLQEIGLGLVLSTVASGINFVVALLILRAGRRHNSITLEANAHHLFTDVWTSAGVIAALGLVAFTHWQWLDPLIALAVAANIIWTGVRIVRRSVAGLMDVSLTPEDLASVRKVFHDYEKGGVQFHALRSRQSGARKFISTHVLVPGEWSVQRGHELLDRIEADIHSALPDALLFTHLESLDDPASWDDENLERGKAKSPQPPA